MGLNVRIYNVTFTHNYKVEYRTNTYTGTYTFHSFQSAGASNVTIGNLEFDTLYYVKLTDLITGQYVITQIVTHDSKFYDCYDRINFILSASTCSCGDYEIQLIDLTSPSGNHSSVINGVPNSYYIYSGTTHYISGATFITTATTNPSTNIIYQTSGYTEEQTLIYFFVVHGDGFLTGTTDNCPCYLDQPKKQGGFDVKAINLCSTPSIVTDWIWSGDTFSCIVEPTFSIRKTISGLHSPQDVYYESDTGATTYGRVYVADGSNKPNGNVYWFDPLTATTLAHMNYYTGNSLTDGLQLRFNSLYTNYFDSVYKRIYFVGTDTNDRAGNSPNSTVTGLISYDMTANTHSTVYTYGSNKKFNRTFLLVSDNYILLNYTNDLANPTTLGFIRLDRSNFGNPLVIPFSGSTDRQFYFSTSPQQVPIGNYIWVVNSGGGVNGTCSNGWDDNGNCPKSGGRIGIFDTSYNLINEIVVPNVATFNTGFGNCCMYAQNLFYDETSDKIYLSDGGSNQRIVIQPTPEYSGGTIIYSANTNNIAQGIIFSFKSWTIDPVSNDLYENFSAVNQSAAPEVSVQKYYIVDRDTYEYKKIFTGTTVSSLKQVDDGLPTSIMGCSAGDPWWGSGPTYTTDGTITIYNNNVGGTNNGYVNYETLYEFDVATLVPTGNIKPNDPLDIDYIPPFFDVTLCPITYTSGCPITVRTIPPAPNNTVLTYELQFDASTVANPAISSIVVNLVNSTLSVDESSHTYNSPYTEFSDSYVSSGFTLSSPANTYTTRIEYYSGATLINTCT